MMKFKQSSLPKLRLKHPKRVIILSLVAILLIAAGIYAFLSHQAWQSFNTRSQELTSHLKVAIDDSLGNDAATEAPATQIDAVVSDFSKRYGNQPCQISSTYAWQTVLPAVKALHTSCEERSKNAVSVIDALKPLSQFLKDNKAAATLVTAAIDATATPTDYTAASTTWQDLAVSSQLSTIDAFTPVTGKIKEVAAAIGAAYTALASATAAEDKTAFDNATTGLQAAYARVGEINSTATPQQEALATKALEAYKKL